MDRLTPQHGRRPPAPSGAGGGAAPQCRPRRGLTLVETIVAVAIAALLLGLLLPMLGRVRAQARSAECQGNLRQLAVAAGTYATIHRDRFPPAILYFATPGGLVTQCWDFTHRPGGDVAAGALRGLTDRPEQVQQCPCCERPSTFGNDPATGYNYNTTFIGAEGRWPVLDDSGRWLDGWNNARLGVPTAAHRRPSTTALLGDGGWSGGANKFMRAPGNTVEHEWGLVYAGAQAFRHLGGANIAWLDGHVSTVQAPSEGPLGDSTMARQIMGFPANGFIAGDDSAYDPR
jgi:prepilin-type processing-associated H-X9-DG protein/prepilin-type N-terminal cleavage/methylation domain-containing protein